MKINKLQNFIDDAAFVILLFVPIVICIIITGIEKIVKIVTKKDIHIIND